MYPKYEFQILADCDFFLWILISYLDFIHVRWVNLFSSYLCLFFYSQELLFSSKKWKSHLFLHTSISQQ